MGNSLTSERTRGIGRLKISNPNDNLQTYAGGSERIAPPKVIKAQYPNEIPRGFGADLLLGYPTISEIGRGLFRRSAPFLIYEGLSQPVARDEDMLPSDLILKGGIKYYGE